jgi:hypothetical protein
MTPSNHTVLTLTEFKAKVLTMRMEMAMMAKLRKTIPSIDISTYLEKWNDEIKSISDFAIALEPKVTLDDTAPQAQ